MRLETSLNVKSSVVTKEEVTVSRDGKIVDERSRETKENNSYSSTTSEIWEPIGVVQRQSQNRNNNNVKPFDGNSSDESSTSRPNSNASSDQGYTSSNNVLRERGGGVSSSGSGLPTCPYCGDGEVGECPRNCCLTALAGLGLNSAGDVVDGDVGGGAGGGGGRAGKVRGVQNTTSAVRDERERE